MTPNIIKLKKSDKYICCWKLDGIPHETIDAQDLAIFKEQFHTLLRQIGRRPIALWSHVVRRKFQDRLQAQFPNEYLSNYNDVYFDSFKGYSMMANELYLTLVFDRDPSPVFGITGSLGYREKDFEEYCEDEVAAIKEMSEIISIVEASMKKYGIEPLTTYKDERNLLCSQPIEFLQFLVSGKWQKVQVPRAPISEAVGGVRFFANASTPLLRSVDGDKYMQILTVTDYTEHTSVAMMTPLMYSDYEFILTQSFAFMPKNKGIAAFKRQANQMRTSGDLSKTQLTELEGKGGLLDQLQQGRFLMGEYHFSLAVFGDDENTVNENKADAAAILGEIGLIVRQEDEGAAPMYFAQIPGQFRERARIAYLTSRNFSGLSGFHNFLSGKRDKNPWGQAVTLLKSPSGQPIYFNFHSSKLDEDSEDKKISGNTTVIGMTGSGKTVLLMHLLNQLQKYKTMTPPRSDGKPNFSTVFFDKDRGAELGIRMLGGNYLKIENSEASGMNPLLMEPTSANIDFTVKLFKYLAEYSTGGHNPIKLLQEEELTRAVRTTMNEKERSLRSLSYMMEYLPMGKTDDDKENSLQRRLAKWTHKHRGSLAWVFDNPKDQIDFDSATVIGIDGTAFLDNEMTRTAISMYLLHRMEDAIDGRRFAYFMDEFWKWVLDPVFGDFANDKQKTIRKKNGFGVLATQSPVDVLKNKHAKTMVEQSITQIFLPNRKADHDDYVEGFKTTEKEYRIISNLADDSRQFLIKQNGVSTVASLNLNAKAFDDYLVYMSGSEDNIRLFDEVVSEVGDELQNWLPLFQRRRSEIKNSMRGNKS